MKTTSWLLEGTDDCNDDDGLFVPLAESAIWKIPSSNKMKDKILPSGERRDSNHHNNIIIIIIIIIYKTCILEIFLPLTDVSISSPPSM
jgi:hypothetical protein